MIEALIDYDEVLEWCEDFAIFQGVTFQADFGPWHKGDKAAVLQISFKCSKAEELDENNQVINSCGIKLQAC